VPKVSPIQSSFTGGEFSPRLRGRSDTDRYRTGLSKCENYVPSVEGPLDRRPGTYYVADVKTHSLTTRVVPFVFSTTQAYVIEFGNLYCRFYKDYGRIESPPGTPVEIVTPYLTAHLQDLQFVQSADVLYVFHPSYLPRKITRTSHTAWTISTITFIDGPYLSTNATTTTLTPSGFTGAITVTASSTTGINSNAGFATTDVGRYIRMKVGANPWGYVQITGWTSTTVVNATVVSTLTAAAATTSWRMGLYSDTTGYPACGTFYEDRLFLGGVSFYPQRVDGSVSGDYENMAPTATDGTVAATNAVGITLNSDSVNAIRWLVGDEKGLLVGTAGGPWVIRPTTTGEALSATNVNAKQLSASGAENAAAVQSGKSVLYIQAGGRKVRELTYAFEADGFISQNLTALSEHITEGGLDEVRIQREPKGVVWGRRADGMLVSLTFERDQESVRAGWAKHPLGGYSDSGQTADPIVESIAVIPSPDGTRDDLWLVVKRYINGGTVRYVEFLMPFFEDTEGLASAFFVDCGLTYDGAAASTISGLDHLKGQTVSILGDGLVFPDQTVTAGGQVTLSQTVTMAHIGLPYVSDGATMRLDVGAADGTAFGKTQRIHRVAILFHRSLGLNVGPSFDALDPWIFRTAGDDLGEPAGLFSGVKSEPFDGDYSDEALICWRQNQPLPSTILAIMPQMHTEDR
jgi:hypothetical protein